MYFLGLNQYQLFLVCFNVHDKCYDSILRYPLILSHMVVTLRTLFYLIVTYVSRALLRFFFVGLLC